MVHDLIVIGTGPAGITAGLYAGRHDLDTVLVERDELGGTLVDRPTIDTYPGFPEGISGPELRTRIVEQLREYTLDLQVAEVTAVELGSTIHVTTSTGELASHALILASGASPTPLTCPGAADYDGKGIFHCAACDGPLYADTPVGIVGNQETALLDSLFLAEHASRVFLIVDDSQLHGTPYTRDKVHTNKTIEVRYNTEITAVTGTDVLTNIELTNRDTNETTTERVNGLLIQTDPQPNTAYLPPDIQTTTSGAVTVDKRLTTNHPGVFAAGSVREAAVPTITSAVGDGSRAFESAREFLEST